MGVSFSLIPFIQHSSSLIKWIASYSVSIPSILQDGRLPSEQELRVALENLPDCSINYRKSEGFSQIEIRSQGEIVTLEAIFRDKEIHASNVSLSGNYSLITKIVIELSKICGTLILTQNGEDPVLFFTSK